MNSGTLIAIASAVAWMMWTNAKRPSGSPVGLPPLPSDTSDTLPLPGLPGPPAGLSGTPSVHPAMVAMMLVPWGLVAWTHLVRPTPGPQPTPDVSRDIDLRGAWVGETAAEDATTTQCLMADLAWFIDDDRKSANPRLVTGSQMAELRAKARRGYTHGISLADRQPRAIDLIAAYLDKEIGSKGGPLTAEEVEKWVRALDTVSKAAGESLGR
jgi:hypothetical protein